MTSCVRAASGNCCSLWLFVTVLAACSAAWGQTPDLFVDLRAAQYEIDRLSPDISSGSAVFVVDEATTVRVLITAGIGELETSIEGPSGEVLDADTIESFGGTYGAIEGAESADSAFISPVGLPGFHFFYRFPSLGAGTYTVHFSATVELTGDAAVITELATDSTLAVSVFATEPVVVQGATAVLTAALYEGAVAMTGATVVASIVPPDSDAFSLDLLDNGIDADDAVGDGLYSNYFVAAEAGLYTALVEITDTNSIGTPFARTAATQILVVEPTAQFASTTFTDEGQDDNDNDLFERVVVAAEVDVSVAGTYAFAVVLETAGGQVLLGTGEADLTAGTARSIEAAFAAELFLAANEDGPYTITDAELVLIDETDGAVPADRFDDGTQLTQAYLVSQFERPAIQLTGDNSDMGVDTDSDGDFDELTVNVGVDVLVAGVYEYSVRLVDPCMGEIEFIVGDQTLEEGVNALEFTFAGSLIGAGGVDGPYVVRELLMAGPGGSLVETTVAETQFYTADQFDEYAAAPDCNTNGTPDGCDVFAATGADCNTNLVLDGCELAAASSPDCDTSGVPDECEGSQYDCNTNGQADYCDLVIDGGEDCNTNGQPDECEVGNSLTSFEAFPATAILDGVTVTTPSIVVAQGGPPGDVDLELDIRHTYDADLDIFVVHGGTTVELSTDNGVGGDNYTATVFDENASISVIAGVAPFTGTFNPEGNLDAYIGQDMFGEWWLEVGDDLSGDTGTVLHWALLVTSETEDCNSNGEVDSCETATGSAADCDTNGVMDDCDASGCNTNGVPDACELAGNDCNTNGALDECESLGGVIEATQDTDLVIPDDSVVLSSLSVEDSGTLTDVDILLNIRHTYDADLDVFLIHDATTVELFTDVGGAGDNFTGTLLDEEATTPITSGAAPFTGTYDPEGDLDLFDGQDMAGTWTLSLDDDTPYDTGTLLSWALFLEFAVVDCNTSGIPDECEADCNTNGAPDDCDIADGDSTDSDGNGVPDDCEPAFPACSTQAGDLSGDDLIDGDDIDGLVECLFAFPPAGIDCGCADMDGDEDVDNDDLALFTSGLLAR